MTNAIINLVIQFIGAYLKYKSADDQVRREFIAFVEIMNAKGLASVQMRLNARAQVDRVAQAWHDEEKK